MPSSVRVSHDGEDQTEVLGGGDPRLQPRLGRYRLERRIGQGGMAEVFLARAEGPGGFEKQVVIKRIRPHLARNERFVEMFLREGRLLAGLDHPNIVRIFELDEQDGEYFIALEYLDGLTLREVVERHWAAGLSVPLEPLLQVFADAALGLSHAHGLREPSGAATNLVHRDVSPDNLFVTSASVTKVLDFGIAKREGHDILTQTGELKGKIQFMAPEALKGEALDARADLWSFGVTMYWACAGRRPFDGVTEVHTIKSILEDPPRSLRAQNPQVPHLVEQVIFSCLEKERGRRIGSAEALHDSLSTLLLALPRGAPSPADLCARAQGLPPIDYEVTPEGPAVRSSVAWPEHTLPAASGPPASSSSSSSVRGGQGRNAVELPPQAARALAAAGEAPTQVARKPQTDLPATDKVKQRQEREHGAASAWNTDFEGATEQMAAGALHTTDKHRRAVQSTEHSDTEHVEEAQAEHAQEVARLDLTGPQELAQLEQTGPQGLAQLAQEPGDFAPPSDPIIDVEREPRAAPLVSPDAPTMPHVALEPSQRAPLGPRPDIHSQATQAIAAISPWPDPMAIEIPPPARSRTGPVIAGVLTTLALLLGALHLTGTLDGATERLRGVLGAVAPGLADAGATSLADASDPSNAALSDAGAARTDDAGALADARQDAGSEASQDVDAGAPVAVLRELSVSAPAHVQWLGPTAEPLAKGDATLKLAPDTEVIFARDLRREATSRIVLDAKQRTVDYAQLPRGKLTVSARPNAEVYLGRERLGRTPLGPVSLVAGSYEVRLRYKKRSKTIAVEVHGGKSAVVKHSFR